MCGITGAVWNDPRWAVDEAALRRMTDVLRHRGPDDEGFYWDAAADGRREGGRAGAGEAARGAGMGGVRGVALGFRRLAVIDLERGRQPLANERGDVQLVFNGEIYNYRQLRAGLEARGHRFRSRSDTETIVHLYEDEGLACFSRLNGMFALALWDARRGRLVLARDRLGQKPLVYQARPERLVFASELKSLREAPGPPLEIDPAAIDAYLTYQYVPHPRTIYRGVCKLPPGCYAVYERGRLTVVPYWRPACDRERPLPAREAADQVRELFASSVRLRLQSDVPLGAFLSGGVDSSLVAAMMQRETGGGVQTFSIGFPVPEYDETRYARLVAAHLGTEHREFQVRPACVNMLPQLVWHFDEPFADSSAVPTWWLAEMTRRHVTVALSGDGGDELWAGYPRYRAVWLGAALDRAGWARRAVADAWGRRLPDSPRQKSLRRRLRRFVDHAAAPPARRYLQWIAIFHEHQRAELYREEFVEQLPDDDPAAFVEQAWAASGRRGPVTAASLADLVTYLPCDLMTKIDIATMAHSLECRQPFLDYRLVELAVSLPASLKFRWGRGKRLLQTAFRDLLPPAIWRRRKMGFGVPLDHWLRKDLRAMTRHVLLDPAARCHRFFRPQAVRRFVEQHQSGRFDHSYRLWALLVLELWLRRWER